MRKLDDLFALADKEGIHIAYFPFSEGVDGLYIREKNFACIMLSNSLKGNIRAQTVVLAHELGHHFTARAGRMLPTEGERLTLQRKLEIEKCEHDADRWGLEYLAGYSFKAV